MILSLSFDYFILHSRPCKIE